ncbi:unnamed protein product, partial [Nesidiocoris tenuis]
MGGVFSQPNGGNHLAPSAARRFCGEKILNRVSRGVTQIKSETVVKEQFILAEDGGKIKLQQRQEWRFGRIYFRNCTQRCHVGVFVHPHLIKST